MLLRPKKPSEKADADVADADTHRTFSHAMMQYRAAEIAQINDEHEPK